MKIGVIIGSVRESRVADQVADWVLERATEHGGAEFVRVDLKEFNLPLLTDPTVPGAADKQYDDAATAAWSAVIDGLDGFIFVTPEYNHSVPGAFKNAFDLLGAEWSDKAVAFVSYGADNGVRAVEHWRGATTNMRLYGARSQLSFARFGEFGEDMNTFTPNERREGEMKTLLEEFIPLTQAISTLR